DQIRAQQLAAHGGSDLRYLAGAGVHRLQGPRCARGHCLDPRETAAELHRRVPAVSAVAEMTDAVVLEQPAEGVALVRINRPEARNALNMAVRRRLAELFRGFADDKALRCVVLT